MANNDTLKEQICSFFKDIAPEAYHIEDAAYMLGIKGSANLEEYMRAIAELTEEGKLKAKPKSEYYRWAAGEMTSPTAPLEEASAEPLKPKFQRIGAPQRMGSDREFGRSKYDKYTVMEGIFKVYRKTFGFVISPGGKEDVYVSAENFNGAMHNDKVRVRTTVDMNGKTDGIITDVLERANETIVGTYDRQKEFGFVIPDDERLVDDVYVALPDTLNARSGAKVIVTITKWPENGKRPEGIITEILGYKGDKGLDINCIMAQHKLPFKFPEDVIKESEKISKDVHVDGERLDLRDWQLITIDGEDAKDLDDAVSCTIKANGNYELGVHIADVSNYVTARTAIDREAYNRGTSVYLVDRVIPMLPEVLSNGICSLNAGEDRYAMSCIMEINHQGEVVNRFIRPSVIRVGRRCSYTEVFKALTQDIIPDDLVDYMHLLHNLQDVASDLTAMRHRRGAIDFDFPEYKVLLDEDGTPLKIVKRERTIAERLIEECMLIANETVATFLRDTDRPSVYRIHELPSTEKLGALQAVCTYLGKPFNFEGDEVAPLQIQQFLESLKGTDIEPIAQIMTLRSMQQARYSTVNVGHFGLASECYTHFTSPIRRYPDLMVHRLVKRAIGWKDGYSKRDTNEEFLVKACDHSSEREQVAVAAERDTVDLKRVQYMEPFVGQTFEGRISSITSFGMFVELDNGVDGLVHISMMDDDYYEYDEEHFLLYGRRTGKEYHLGDAVTVTLIKADTERKQIDFVLGEITDIGSLQGRLAQSSSRDMTKKSKSKKDKPGSGSKKPSRSTKGRDKKGGKKNGQKKSNKRKKRR